jgi:hypothetical protein
MVRFLLVLLAASSAWSTTIAWYHMDMAGCEALRVFAYWHNPQLAEPDDRGVARGVLVLEDANPPWYMARWCIDEPQSDPMPWGSTIVDSLRIELDNGLIVWYNFWTTHPFLVHNPNCGVEEPLILPPGSMDGCNGTAVPDTRPRDLETRAWPNPFNPATTIHWTQPRGGRTGLDVYDLLGNRVGGLDPRFLPAGPQDWVFQAEGLPSGTYLFRITGPGWVHEGKVLLLR